MLSVLIGAVANIVLDPVFIFGMNMGVRGAALATIISQTLSCIWVLSFLFGKKTFLKIKPENLRLHAKIILPCVALGSSLFIMQASESIISVCFNSSLLKIRRRYCRWCHDNPYKCNAVRNASASGTWSGSSAYYEL